MLSQLFPSLRPCGTRFIGARPGCVAGDLREDSGCGPNTDSWHAAQDRMDTFGLKNKMEVELIRKIKQKKTVGYVYVLANRLAFICYVISCTISCVIKVYK